MRSAILFCVVVFLAACGQTPAGKDGARVQSPSPLHGLIRASGTEPFWSVAVSPEEGLVYSEAASPDTIREAYAPPQAIAGGGKFVTPRLQLTLTAGSCSDGMSDIDYPLTATVIVGDRTLKGCAYYPWGANVRAFVPAIDACLAKAPLRMPVTHAAQVGDVARIRMSASGPEETYDCTYRAGEATVKRAEGQLPGERNPVFYRLPIDDPGESCAPHIDVRDDKGELLGWTIAEAAC